MGSPFMNREQVVVPQWLQLPREIRLKLVKEFGLQSSSGVVMQQVDGVTTITCDGHTNEDLRGITLNKLEALTGEKGIFWDLFDMTIAKLEGKEMVIKPKVGRPKKNENQLQEN